MGEIKTIKDVGEDSWSSFKSIAAKNSMKMGKLFEKMVNEYNEKSEGFWNDILKGEKILSEKEAEDMKKIVSRVRGDIGFRK